MKMYLRFILAFILTKIKSFLPDSSKVNERLNYLLIIIIGSNHSRRLGNLKKIIKNRSLYDYELINFKYFCPINNYKRISIFVGDSHSEFYGRNFNLNSNKNKKNLFLTYHTGPTLLSTFGTSSQLIKRIYNFIIFIKNYNLNKTSSLNIIFSLGEIDIRNFYYQVLKLDKSFKNEKILTKFIVNSFLENFLNLQKMLKKNKIKKVKFFFKDITPTTYKKSYNPKTIKDLEKIRKNNPFPVIGELKKRIHWRKILSNQIKKKCRNKNIKFIELNKENFNKNGCLNKLKTFDNGHISDLKLLSDVQLKVF